MCDTSIGCLRPDLIQFWDSDKNNFSPFQVCVNTVCKIHWICPNGHKFKRAAFKENFYCKHCNAIKPDKLLSSKFPDIAKEWDFSKNKKNLSIVSAFSIFSAFWICPVGHSWKTSVAYRTKFNRSCTICSKQVPSTDYNLLTVHPSFSAEWDYIRNEGKWPEEFLPNSNKKVWWICNKCGYNQIQSVSKKSSGHGCRACSKQVATPERNLFVLFPEISSQINKDMHPDIDTFYINPCSTLRLNWICDKCSRSWRCMVYSRTHLKTNCPFCRSSKTEDQIAKYLSNCSLNYQRQYKFTKIKRHSFDFAVFNKHNKLFLIEYHGQQHYKPITFSKKADPQIEFEKTKSRDAFKKKFCKDNCITLYEIAYFDDVESILEMILQIEGIYD